MLILNRRMGEAVVMDGGIRIVILSCDRRGVRLGIEAPAETTVLREELSAIRYPLFALPATIPGQPRAPSDSVASA
jgi:carbon storage regulator CsrA